MSAHAELPLGEVCTIVGGGTPRRGNAAFFGGSIPWATPTDVTALEGPLIDQTRETITEAGLRESSARLVPSGTVLMTSRATIGYTAIAAVPMATNQGFANLVCGDQLLPEYLAFWLRGQRSRLIQLAGGTTFKELPKSTLKKVRIPLPPLDEQRRIVNILNRAARIEALRRRATERLREFVPALFVKTFGDEQHVAVRFPTMPLREAAAIASGATKGRKLDPADAIDVPYLRVANVQDGFLALDEIKTITIRRGEQKQYALAPGDLLMTEGGDQDKLGRAAIWNGELPYCAHQNHVFRVRPRVELVLTDYLRDVAGSAYGKAYFLSVAKRTTGIASINKTQLGGFPVPVPPLRLQRRYAETVAVARAAARVREASASTTRALVASLLSELLRNAPLLGHPCRHDAVTR